MPRRTPSHAQPPLGVTVRGHIEELSGRLAPFRARVHWYDPETGERRRLSTTHTDQETAAARTPAAVLAGAFNGAAPQVSALAAAVESAQETDAIRTPVELLADATELATAGRTARWLDQLVHDGHLTENQRGSIDWLVSIRIVSSCS